MTYKKTTNTSPSKQVIHKMMDSAMHIDKECQLQCRNFTIMTSPLHQSTLILRWMTIDISDIDRPIQNYRYECFDMKGTPQHCSIYYTNQEEANTFFEGLQPLYTQEFSIEHKL